MATTSRTCGSRSPRPTTAAARASTRPSTASRAPRRGPRYSAPFNVTSDGTRDDRVPLGRQGRQRRGDQVGHDQARQDRPGHHRQAQRRGAEGQLRRVRSRLTWTPRTRPRAWRRPRSASTAASGSRTRRRRRSSTPRPTSPSGRRPVPGSLIWNTADGGFARTSGGLGLPWYPVKDYGDFSLKFQWRDSGTGSNGNGGAFVRFPNPVEAAARPAANRYPCQVGSGQTDPAWVAIYCGHEIQVNDHHDERDAEDRFGLQLLAAERHAGEGPAEGHVGRLRDQGRRPDVHDQPQRRGAAGVREHPGQAVLAQR